MSDFPSKQNPQPCRNGCGTKIYLSDKKEKGKWLPYDPDDTVHDCPNWVPYDYTVDEIVENTEKKPYPNLDKFKDITAAADATASNKIQDITGQPGQKEPTIGQLKTWIAKLDDIGVHIDINKILDPKREQKTQQK